METRFWMSPLVQEKVHIIFKLIHVLLYIDTFKSKNYSVLWTVAMCTTSLHSKFYKIVLWCECTRIIWTYYFALVTTPGYQFTLNAVFSVVHLTIVGIYICYKVYQIPSVLITYVIEMKLTIQRENKLAEN